MNDTDFAIIFVYTLKVIIPFLALLTLGAYIDEYLEKRQNKRKNNLQKIKIAQKVAFDFEKDRAI